jgi:hypothetical protein
MESSDHLAAATRAIEIGALSYGSLRSILDPRVRPATGCIWLGSQLPAIFIAARAAGCVQVFGRRNAEAIPALGEPASEKRQGTKSPVWGTGSAAGAMGIWLGRRRWEG